ncbi:MAG: HAD hydrolase-like protein [Microbacterium sp.]|uniref:HAD family hydrolase n=1 Tax=Microbacterium sp. TaxID=51671 RepID=UPI0025DFA93C|nr:NIF family HAD-type phosphatase [Microbacterium sp.]MBQ9917181.1 HAD hydrolase-like protein [Microbacterium sp.]
MNLDLILLDLDETLLPTDSLRDARHSHTSLELLDVPGFDAIRLHEGVAASLDSLATLTRVGLVTSSPRWYVDQILAAHLPNFVFAVQVTYEDVGHIKPHPEPLEFALGMTSVDPQRALYVGDADVDFDASTAAGVQFIGAGWADRPTFPASAPRVRTPHDLVELIWSRA